MARSKLEKVARTTAFLILICDTIAGLAWVFGAPNRSATPVYRPLRNLLSFLPGDPARWWGGLLLLLAATAALTLVGHSELNARRAFAPLFAFWAMFAVAYLWGVLTTPNAGIASVGIALICCIGHARPIIAPQRLTVRAR